MIRKGAETWVRAAACLVIGTPTLGVGLMAFRERPSCSSAFTVVFALLFVFVGVRYLLPKAVRFDERRRLVRIARRDVPFSTIAGLQLLPEAISSTNRVTYTSWELNLVLKDGSRLNVTDHAKVDQLRAEAAQLSRLIDCPVWDHDRR